MDAITIWTIKKGLERPQMTVQTSWGPLKDKYNPVLTHIYAGAADEVRRLVDALGPERDAVVAEMIRVRPGLLIDAAGGENSDMVKALIEIGLDVNTNSADGTALHAAAASRCLPIVQYLVEHGANVDALNFNNATPLVEVLDGLHYPEVALYLIEQNATCDDSVATKNGNSAAWFVLWHDLPDVFVAMAKKGALDPESGAALSRAAKSGAIKCVAACLKDPVLCLPAAGGDCETIIASCADDEIRQMILSWRGEQAVASAFGEMNADAEPTLSSQRISSPTF